MTTLTIPPEINAQPEAAVDLSSILMPFTSEGPRRRAPLFIPSEQAYFWTQEWQDGEAEALREIEAGNVKHFTSGRDAIAWLLSDDE
jgi:hypothetical protein